MITKVCSTCLVEKELDKYCKDKNCKHGVKPNCKECRSKLYKNWRSKNKKKIQAYEKTYRPEYNKRPSRKLAEKNRGVIKAKYSVDNLTDLYVASIIRRNLDGITTADVRKYPLLIQLKRKQIILKRKIYGKQKNQNKNSKRCN